MASINATRLQLYLDAEAKILRGQSVRMGERQVTMADLAEVRKEIAALTIAVGRELAFAVGRGGRFAQADFGGRT